MAIATDSYIDVLDNNSDVVDRIGLSKTLDNYTAEELMAFAYCSNTDKLFRDIRHGLPSGSTVTGVGFTNVTGGIPCIWSRVSNPNYWILRTEQGTAGNQNNQQGLYKVVVWLYGADPTASNTLDYNNPYYSDLADLKVVTKWDAPHYLFDVHSIGMYNTADFGATSWGNPKTAEAWEISGKTYTLDYHTDLKSESDEAYSIPTEAGKVIKPYNLFLVDGNIYIKPIIPIAGSRSVYGMASTYFTTFNASSTSECSCVLRDASGNNPIGVNNAIASLYSNTAMSTAIAFPYDVRVDNNGTDYGIDANGYKIIYYRQGTSSPSRSVRITYLYDKEDDLKLLVAGAGLHFKADKVYKPIINGGHVDGFSDVLTDPSELDGWHDNTDHGVTPVPPTPSGTDEDNTDPVNTTGAPFAAGLCHYYALTAGSVLLEHISEALGTWDIENTHKDLYKNLVSCKLVKPPAAIPTTGSEPFTIYGVKPQYHGADITLPVVSGNPDASFGPYTIGRKFGDFRDYAPYTRVSIYLPCCGWCDLPSHVVGRSVSVHYYTDIIAATCKAVVFCNNNIIAEAAGVIGLDIPFVADNVGAKMQAVTAGMIAALGGGIQLGAGIGTMVSTKSGNGAKAALSGASQYLSGYSQMAMAFNENTTEISGKNGDGCCIAGATNIIIKIVRPKYGDNGNPPYVPPGYGHNIGFVSQKQVRVSSVSGLLIADNVDTSGISGATEAERAEIKRVLETGLIVNAAPE